MRGKKLKQAVIARYQSTGEQAPAYYPVYEYEYEIHNDGENAVQVNFSSWEFIHSSFTQAAGGFAVPISGKTTKKISFVSVGEPTEVLSPMNLGVTDEKNGKFYTTGGGMKGLYMDQEGISISSTEK